jgi:NAD-dependent dihydropyrimidine dehydrogenase PreA subunit/nitrate reductase gamma subunit
MTFDSLIEGPFLLFSLAFFTVGVIIRLALSSYAIVKNRGKKETSDRSLPSIFPGFIVPLLSLARRRPFYFLIRLLFHVSLVVVAVWYSGHIALWEASALEMSWSAIPDEVADYMSIGVMLLLLYFLVRRIGNPLLRSISSFSDYLLVFITGAPFLTGYLLTHGTADNVWFIGDHMETLHIVSGEVMLIMIVVLFWKVRLIRDRCTGCASCEISCPTRALQYRDTAGFRIFKYLDLQCIACGACVNACPEDAAELGHVLDLTEITRLFSSQEIGQVALRVCEKCKAFYAPEPQIEKIFGATPTHYGALCPKCRMINHKEKLVPLSRRAFPLRRQQRQEKVGPDSSQKSRTE